MDGQLLERQLNDFRQALRKDPQDAYRRYGMTLLHSLDEETYFAELTRFGWKPETALDCYNQGVMATNRGDHQEALRFYEQAVEKDPELACAYYNLACTYEELGEENEQREALKRYLDLQSKRERREMSEQEVAEVEAAKEALAGLKGRDKSGSDRS